MSKDQPRGYHGQFVSRKKSEQEEIVGAAILEYLKDNDAELMPEKDFFFITDWLISNGVKVFFGMFVMVATLYLAVRI
jgi:hypothetical protein